MQRIYLHGLGQTPESWRSVIAASKAAERSACPDLAGLLRGKEATYSCLYESVSALCDRAEGKIDLCGLSLGAVLALNYAIERPESVKSLALIAPQYKMPKRLLRAQNMLFRCMPSSMFAPMGLPKEAFIRLCGTMAELDFSASLAQVSCPVLVMYGKKDRANQKAAIRLAGILKDARLQAIDGAGHEVNRDAPEELAEALERFYDETK